MGYLKSFSDEEIVEMIRNFMEIYKLDLGEAYMERVESLLTELDDRYCEKQRLAYISCKYDK